MRFVFNKINKDIFTAVRDGSKKVETRAATVKYKGMKAGESVTFSCDGETFEKIISKVTHFNSIDSLIKKYKPQDINPKLTTKEELEEMYHSFPGYKEKIEKEGIVAIEFK
jgi:ASC-1-like (ASCH) protein